MPGHIRRSTRIMSRLLRPLEGATKSVSLLTPSTASLRRISGCLLHQRGHYDQGIPRRPLRLRHAAVSQPRQWYGTSISKSVAEPLHILFCGSDDFSCASLKALHDEHVRNPDLIRSIDVVVRPGKRVGRGYRHISHPPIRSLAESLGLQIHVRDTFTGWDMPTKTNLIIAVSFGLFVPPRLLHRARYGGLNLHPSLLPDLRGPAPLQHTLLLNRKITGVTLQTLDDRMFDHGIILSRTPSDPRHPKALHIPSTCRTVPELQELVTPVATEMLINGLRNGLHLPPRAEVGWELTEGAKANLMHAPKITKAERRVDLALLHACEDEAIHAETLSVFSNQSAPREEGEEEAQKEKEPGILARRQSVIGPLWLTTFHKRGEKRRVIIEHLEELPPPHPESFYKSYTQSQLQPQLPSELASINPSTFTFMSEATTPSSSPSSFLNPVSVEGKTRSRARILIETEPNRAPGHVHPFGLVHLAAGAVAAAADPTYTTYKEYIIPFEDAEDEERAAAAAPDSDSVSDPKSLSQMKFDPTTHTKWLVFWGWAGPGAHLREKYPDELYLGNYRIVSLKVEGQQAKPARLALRTLIDEQWDKASHGWANKVDRIKYKSMEVSGGKEEAKEKGKM
ncbi:hypothetical protein F4808DRAFT_422735 [Astrocystis sublimbata]|nr:hypothetical protein F4808DRAFT_422735 [Astrocystis sublimbata]